MRPVFRTSEGHPLHRLRPSLGDPGPIFFNLGENAGAMLLQTSKIPRQHFDTSQRNGTDHTLKIKYGFGENMLIINPHKSIIVSICLQARASPKPMSLKEMLGGIPKGISIKNTRRPKYGLVDFVC